ncbi:hypothetical protein AAZX31_20G172800 [Glycine max]
MRYYYAVVVECDSITPDNMEFKHPPRDVATEVPANYEPVFLFSSINFTRAKFVLLVMSFFVQRPGKGNLMTIRSPCFLLTY